MKITSNKWFSPLYHGYDVLFVTCSDSMHIIFAQIVLFWHSLNKRQSSRPSLMLRTNWELFLYCERMRVRCFVSTEIEGYQLIDKNLKKYETWINAGIHTNKQPFYVIELQSNLPLFNLHKIDILDILSSYTCPVRFINLSGRCTLWFIYIRDRNERFK